MVLVQNEMNYVYFKHIVPMHMRQQNSKFSENLLQNVYQLEAQNI